MSASFGQFERGRPRPFDVKDGGALDHVAERPRAGPETKADGRPVCPLATKRAAWIVSSRTTIVPLAARARRRGRDGGGEEVGRTVRPRHLRAAHGARHDDRMVGPDEPVEGEARLLDRVRALDDDRAVIAVREAAF